MKFSSLNTKNFLIFSQKKIFLIFREMEPTKKLLIFEEGALKSENQEFLIFQFTLFLCSERTF